MLTSGEESQERSIIDVLTSTEDSQERSIIDVLTSREESQERNIIGRHGKNVIMPPTPHLPQRNPPPQKKRVKKRKKQKKKQNTRFRAPANEKTTNNLCNVKKNCAATRNGRAQIHWWPQVKTRFACTGSKF